MDYKINKCTYCIKKKGCSKVSNKKLGVYDWLSDIPDSENSYEFVEVQFKNTRKGYYSNEDNIELIKGDMVAVESSPGHDIGEVTLVGRLVKKQMLKNGINPIKYEFKKIYRKAKDNDIEKMNLAKEREQETMIKSRQIAESLSLDMKIGDVEFQGDGTKAIFYYIANGRVDFRQLIKVFAETFKIKIEMKQIGARQEAGRIGGIGPCGRELCCSKWRTNFNSVSTNSARHQDLSLNPQKLAGQCGKLKCCMNYELDTYIDAKKKIPSKDINLETKDLVYYHFKTDIFKERITYSTDQYRPENTITITADSAKKIIAMNRRGEKPDRIEGIVIEKQEINFDYTNVVGQDSLTRFDAPKSNFSKNRKKKRQKLKKNSGDN